jgi:hypothetical protein
MHLLFMKNNVILLKGPGVGVQNSVTKCHNEKLGGLPKSHLTSFQNLSHIFVMQLGLSAAQLLF